MLWGERLLSFLSRNPDSPDYPGATEHYNVSNALDFVLKTIPGFTDLVEGKAVLDYGCGPGWQAVAIKKQCQAQRVTGLDISDGWLAMARSLAEKEECSDLVTFGRELPDGLRGTFDVAISISSFEHFGDPARILAEMKSAVKPGGLVIITFAEPWFSHNGSHMGFFTRVPWVNLWFSEKTVLQVRSRFRNDGATRYEDVEGGLNRMTLARFERIINTSGMVKEHLKFHSTKSLPLVAKLPVVRELFVSAATCILRR